MADPPVVPATVATLAAYGEYKKSGLRWLGEIPAHWEVRRVKHWLTVNRRVLPAATCPDYEFDYIDIGSVGTGRLVEQPVRLKFGSAPSRARRVVRSGDTIVSTVRTYLKAVWHAEGRSRNLVASTGFAVLTPSPHAVPRFVSYLCQSESFTSRVMAESSGVSYPAIPESKLRALGIGVPPLAEQRAIAAVLDHETSKIDRLVEKKRELVALLREKRTVLIGQAVTRGLDPDVPMKDSGVEWLGDVPAHWEVRRLKHWLVTNRRVLSENTSADYEVDYVDIGSVGTGRLIEQPTRIRFGSAPSRARRVVRSGDTIVSTVRTYLKAVWHPEGPVADLVASTGFAVLSPSAHAFPKFVSYLCQSESFTGRVAAESSGVSYPAIAESKLRRLGVGVPPLPEQRRIADHLDRVTSKIDALVAKINESIDLLNEYRAALVSAAVTGQIDVRSHPSAREITA